MSSATATASKRRIRLSMLMPHELLKEVKIEAVKSDLSMREYVQTILEHRDEIEVISAQK